MDSAGAKRKAVVLAAAALLVGVMLGAVGYTAWESSRPQPLFSFDPAYITEIRVYGTAAGAGRIAVISDRESIEKIVALLNGFTYKYSEVQTEELIGWESRMELYNPNGVSYIGFSTDNSHEYDMVNKMCSGHLTFYMTDPGYLWEIAEMCSDR